MFLAYSSGVIIFLPPSSTSAFLSIFTAIGLELNILSTRTGKNLSLVNEDKASQLIVIELADIF